MTIEIFILLMKKDTSQQVAFHTWFSLLLIPIISILIWKQRKRVDGLFMWNRLRSVVLDDVNQSTFVQWSQSDGGLFTLLPSVECSDGIWSSRCSGEMKTLSHSFFANNSVWKWQHWKCFCFCQLKKMSLFYDFPVGHFDHGPEQISLFIWATFLLDMVSYVEPHEW